MLLFSAFIRESSDTEIPFDRETNHGFWNNKDSDHVVVYHGTHKRNVTSIEKEGLNRPDPKTGKISVSMDPYTAHAYASMSASGGEANFRKAGSKPVNTPHEDRAVLKFEIPKDWLHKNMDHNLGGNLDNERERMSSEASYNSWRKQNPTGSDHNYYERTEFRLEKPIPKQFYVGHSFKVKE